MHGTTPPTGAGSSADAADAGPRAPRGAVDPAAPEPPRRLLRGSDALQDIVGARVLVGLSFRDGAGGLVRQEQFCGSVTWVGDGVVLVERPCPSGPAGATTTVALPADREAFVPAGPGRYRLTGTGEIVQDLDYLCAWTLLAKG